MYFCFWFFRFGNWPMSLSLACYAWIHPFCFHWSLFGFFSVFQFFSFRENKNWIIRVQVFFHITLTHPINKCWNVFLFFCVSFFMQDLAFPFLEKKLKGNFMFFHISADDDYVDGDCGDHKLRLVCYHHSWHNNNWLNGQCWIHSEFHCFLN